MEAASLDNAAAVERNASSGAYRSGHILIRAAEKSGQKTSGNRRGGRGRHFSSLFLLLSPAPPSAASNSEPQLWPWAFPGAYANYSGSATLLNGIPYTLQFQLRVLAVSGAKAEVVSLMAIQARNKPLSIHRHSAWLRATRSEGRPLELVTNDSLYLTFDSTATVMNKTIPVTVYYYDNKGDTTILFVKKEIGIPVQIVFALDNVTSILVRLLKTNISGLVG